MRGVQVDSAILVVEDDPTLARTIMRNLTVRGYRVVLAMSVAEAMAQVKVQTPALALLDIDLPDGSGWEIARALQSAHCQTMLIIMSALRPNPRLCGEFSPVGVLEKPFPMEALLHLVADHMTPPASTAPDQAHKGVS